jgi:hypothetical protein
VLIAPAFRDQQHRHLALWGLNAYLRRHVLGFMDPVKDQKLIKVGA